LISYLTPKPSEAQLNYTYYAADEKDKAITRASITRWDIINTIIIPVMGNHILTGGKELIFQKYFFIN